MGTRHLYLVRHGQSEPGGSAADALGPGLTVLGWKQAHQTARRLASLKVDVIHTSSLRRAMETAQVLAVEHPDIPIRPAQLLWECVPFIPDFVLQWFKDHPDAEAIPAAIQLWRAAWSGLDPLGNGLTGFEQAQQAWEKYFIPARGKDRIDIVVCHGNLMRYFVVRSLQVAPEAWINIEIYNCAICEIVIEANGRPRLISHNDSGHLKDDQVTYH